MSKSTGCRACVKDAIYCWGPAILMELRNIAKFVRRECHDPIGFDECWIGVVPTHHLFVIFVHAVLLSLVTYPILYACFRSPWLGCMPGVGQAFGTPAAHWHFLQLITRLWETSSLYHRLHRCRQLLWTCWERFRGNTSAPPINAQSQVDVFSTHIQAETGSLNPTPQWILPTNYGNLGARRRTQITGDADENDEEEDDWEEGFWEEGLWEEGIWGEYDSDASDEQSDALIGVECAAAN